MTPTTHKRKAPPAPPPSPPSAPIEQISGTGTPLVKDKLPPSSGKGGAKKG